MNTMATVNDNNEHEMRKHLRESLGGNTDLTEEEVSGIFERFKDNPEDCGRDELNEIANVWCRKFQGSVHLSMLVLCNTMVLDAKTKHLRNSNMHVNHNNPTKTASMEMINNMASNPLKINKKNSNDRSSWGKDMEVYMTEWNKVCGLKFCYLHYIFRIKPSCYYVVSHFIGKGAKSCRM